MSAPERASRQNLVVPPRQGNASVAVGAVVCGCIGFALVWTLGGGRPSAGRSVPAATATTDEPHAPADHDWHPGGHADLPAQDGRPAEPAMPPRPPFADRAVTPASLSTPDSDPLDDARPLSRFSSVASESTPEPAPPVDEPAAPPPGRLALPPAHELAPAAAPPAAEVAVTVDPPLGDPEPLEPGDAPDEPSPADAPRAAGDDAAARTTMTSHEVDDPAAGTDREPAPLPPADEPTEPQPVPTPAAPLVAHEEPSPPPPAAFPAAAPPPAPATVVEPPRPFAPAAPAAPPPSVPFASAPSIVPGVPAHPAAPGASPAPELSGQGRPGPIQLEGVQTPQLTVEKRGPREVQVGKPARYEISVRNVGSAVARDVVLRDAVPYGTTLVTTTPPAAPGRAGPGATSDELVWELGELAPGGQAKIVVELVPQTEGEVGSVASVSFRADASVRSRATKPALAIQCTDPKPVLIGRDAGLTITVTNPGSGVATGVVLEGFLPDNVSHRSGGELEFDVGQLKPGESRPIELVLGTRGPGVHTARFTARADGGIEVQQAVRLEVTAPALELAVDMPVRRFLQRPAACTITMVNAGTAPAKSVELAAQLPPGMKFVKANNAGWHDERTHRVLWNLEELPPGEAGTVEVVVMPVELGPQKIFAAARSADGLSDQAAHVCDVEGLAALVFDVTDSEDPIEVEGVTEYVVRVGNQGTKAATGVRLTATLLGDLEPVEAQGPVGHRVENLTVAFEPLAKLAPSEDAVYRIRAQGHRAGDHRVQVQITSEDHPAPITKEETTRVYLDR